MGSAHMVYMGIEGEDTAMENVQQVVADLETRAKDAEQVKLRAAQAAIKVREALQLLEGVGPLKRMAGTDIREGRVFRPGYVERTVEILRSANTPMSPAQIRDEMMKAIPDVRRDALERQFYNELRKASPRLMQPAKGLYWIKGVAVPTHGTRSNKRKKTA